MKIEAGTRFGRLTVTEDVKRYEVHVVCDCGTVKIVDRSALRRGGTRSCGCLVKRDGHAKSPEYRTWHGMKQRCLNPNSPAYKHYGGRGITVSPAWRDSFEAFYQHVGPRPEGTSIDRIDNDGNYEPGNVRWADRITQANNRRPRAVMVADSPPSIYVTSARSALPLRFR